MDDLVEIRTELLDPAVSDKWVWPKKDHGAWYGPVLNWHQAHKEDFFRHIKKYDVVVTAGGNCGLHTRVFANKFKTVYVFEPEPLNFYCLTRNCSQNNVIKFQAALGSVPGFCEIKGYEETNTGTCSINTNTGIIPVLTIDSLNLPSCDFIQLDVEGHEESLIS